MATRTIEVRHADGLHVRPAELVARTAMRFDSEITLANGSLRIDAKSILNVITLGAHQGTQIHIEAKGEDADLAVAALAELLESDFGADAGQVSVAAPTNNEQADTETS